MSATTVARPVAIQAQRDRRAAILALARVEAVRLLFLPAFLVGLGITLAAIFLRRGQADWGGRSLYIGPVAWTFACTGTLVAAALVAGRQRFLADPDLFPATPATRVDRVLASALALAAPTAVAGIAATVVAVVNVRKGGFLVGTGPYTRSILPSVADWAQPVLLVALAGVVGVVAAQLRRGRLAAMGFLAFATLVGGMMNWAFQAHPIRVLHPMMFGEYDARLPAGFSPDGWTAADRALLPPDQYVKNWREVGFDTTALEWHLLYLAGLILVGVWLAHRLAERPEGRLGRWPLLAGLPLLAVGAVAQLLTAGHV
jgi:hypothetical protein